VANRRTQRWFVGILSSRIDGTSMRPESSDPGVVRLSRFDCAFQDIE